MIRTDEIFDLIGALKTEGARFAVATVVRTVSLTAAKAGAKAVIRADGTIEAGWIGGGCARGAVLRAARAAIADGRPRLVSVQPSDLLQAGGAVAGEDREGIHFEKNLCPSQGSIDVFVEPMLPRPELLVCGATPVAAALLGLARRFGYQALLAAPESAQLDSEAPDLRLTAYRFDDLPPAERYIVVAIRPRSPPRSGRAPFMSASSARGGRSPPCAPPSLPKGLIPRVSMRCMRPPGCRSMP